MCALILLSPVSSHTSLELSKLHGSCQSVGVSRGQTPDGKGWANTVASGLRSLALASPTAVRDVCSAACGCGLDTLTPRPSSQHPTNPQSQAIVGQRPSGPLAVPSARKWR